MITKAYVATGAQLNANLGGASGSQSVNVSAVDSFKSLTIAGGIAGGFVGAAGGVDIGVADIDDAGVPRGHVDRRTPPADVDVNALSRKNVQTYALSAAGGFVGVAVAVSVWTVGTATTSTFHDGAAGPDKGPWSPEPPYNEGDVVTHAGKTWGSKSDGNLGHTPVAGSAFWQGEQDAFSNDNSGNPSGDADFAASGNDADPNSKGYKSVLNGTSNSGDSNVTNQRMVVEDRRRELHAPGQGARWNARQRQGAVGAVPSSAPRPTSAAPWWPAEAFTSGRRTTWTSAGSPAQSGSASSGSAAPCS